MIRIGDARPLELGHVARADGRWRLYIFADDVDIRDPRSRAAALCEFLVSPDSPVVAHTAPDDDLDAVYDVRAILPCVDGELAVPELPAILRPEKGRFGLVDYEKAFRLDPRVDIMSLRGVDRERGALVIVRPDQYVAHVLPLDAHDELTAFFDRFMLNAR